MERRHWYQRHADDVVLLEQASLLIRPGGMLYGLHREVTVQIHAGSHDMFLEHVDGLGYLRDLTRIQEVALAPVATRTVEDAVDLPYDNRAIVPAGRKPNQ
jgi:hypothetical protein